MTANILRMSDAETIRFVELYRTEPVLWDPTRNDYKDRRSRLAAARRTATAMELDGFTELHVIMKFKNLRSSYLQEIKKIGLSMKSGCSSDEVYIPKVKWFSIMDSFLKPLVKARGAKSNLENNSECSESSDEKPDLSEDDSIASKQSNHQEQASNSKYKQVRGQTDSLKRKFQGTVLNTHRKKKATSISAENDIDSTFDNLGDITRIAANCNTDVSEEDCFDYFGKYIASLLRSEPQDRSFQLQSEIVSLILKPTISTTKKPSRP